jgi:hypothetical protein
MPGETIAPSCLGDNTAVPPRAHDTSNTAMTRRADTTLIVGPRSVAGIIGGTDFWR